jgi:hypothetical protein
MVTAMFGFGTKMSTVFASRWKAVTWSMGILLLAYCSVPAPKQTNDQAGKTIAAAKAPHKSPWSKD